MRKIYKYDLQLNDLVSNIITHAGAKFLHFQMQGPTPRVWLEVETNAPQTAHNRYRIVGTGHEVPPYFTYRATCFDTFNGPFVWHLYELLDQSE